MTGRIFNAGSVVLLLLTTAASGAGGWAVITVTDLPESLTVGKPVTIEYQVRQHGQNLLTDLSGSVIVTAGGVSSAAEMTHARGGYTATFTPRDAGKYAITIHSGFTADADLVPIVAVTPGATVAAMAPADRGHDLFIAKGCMTCHTVNAVPGSGPYGIGPVLIAGRLSAEYVASVLADPTKAVVPPNTTFKMPNLNLKPAEIAALTAFLTKTDRTVAAGK